MVLLDSSLKLLGASTPVVLATVAVSAVIGIFYAVSVAQAKARALRLLVELDSQNTARS